MQSADSKLGGNQISVRSLTNDYGQELDPRGWEEGLRPRDQRLASVKGPSNLIFVRFFSVKSCSWTVLVCALSSTANADLAKKLLLLLPSGNNKAANL